MGLLGITRILSLLICLLASCTLSGQNFIFNDSFCRQQRQHNNFLSSGSLKSTGSNGFDVSHYAISLDIVSLNSGTIRGNCIVSGISKMDGLQSISLDLLALNVDSVLYKNAKVPYIYNDTVVDIQLPTALANGEAFSVILFYYGQPVRDASGWGGFYFNNNYAFNLGVGFEANPHNYGRVWFPCVDNFTDRATYDFFITTATANRAFCNGFLQQATNNGNGTITWHWKMNQTIPTYLASVAVADYASLEWDHMGLEKTIPVILGARSTDTLKLKNSFANLPGAIDAFEASYGPYQFDRVGYVLVPFSSGAMEHATNIAYPQSAANGGLQYESLMAHEFAHHWWGNLVTCESAEDMWINEGWATYSEMIFFEHVYDRERYKKEVRKNHKQVLQYSHIKDEGYRAVSGVPHAFTYGSTVYDKGADVAHTLRGYMGDALFFECISSFLNSFSFNHANSSDFRDHLSNCSGIGLHKFFENWVFNPGFPHFSIDSVKSVRISDNYDVMVYVRQKLKMALVMFEQVPLEISFFNDNLEATTQTVFMSGGCGIYHTELGFEPVFVALDIEERISDAITDKFLNITSTGYYDFEEALLEMNVTQLIGEALVRVEHNWVAPDPFKSPVNGLHISKERYWTLDGIFPDGFTANATVLFNGSNSMAEGYLDNDLISNSEDSLVVLYRSSVKDEWALADSFVVDPMGNLTNKRGEATIFNCQKGQYALAIYDSERIDSSIVLQNEPCILLSSKEETAHGRKADFAVYPNPANDSFRIEFNSPLAQELDIAVYDLTGQLIFMKQLLKDEKQVHINVNDWKETVYLIKTSGPQISQTKKLMVIK